MELSALLKLLDQAGEVPAYVWDAAHDGYLTWQLSFSKGDIVLKVNYVSEIGWATASQTFILTPVGQDGRSN